MHIAEDCAGVQDYPPKIDKDGLRTLSALARTCSVLQTPALDLLWYRQNTLEYLVKSLPDDLWDTRVLWAGCKELVSAILNILFMCALNSFYFAGMDRKEAPCTRRLAAF